MATRTDEELMAAYAAGEQAAFAELFERYAPRLLRMMRRRVSLAEDADDLVQQTFLQLHRARADFDPTRRLRPWLWTIAANLQREYFRRRQRRPETSLEVEPEARNGRPNGAVERADQAARVRAALSSLPSGQREVIQLHWFEELSFPEIAEVLGVGLSAVKVRAHRGYRALREVLEASEAVTERSRRPYVEERDRS